MYKMKDSGIAWIGEIPANWKSSKIGQLYRLRNTKVSDKDFPPLSVTNKGILPQLDTVAKSNAHNDRKLVKKGDFAINSRSDRRGSCGISLYDGSVSLINIVLSPLTKMEPTYFDWLFHTTQFGEEFYKWGHGIVDDLWTTTWQDMKKISIPIPPVYDQTRIASFLDSKCAKIDALTADIQAEINILEQYKKSVITEAVTKGLDPTVEMKNSGIEWVGMIPKNWQTSKIKYVCKFSPRCAINFINSETEVSYAPMECIKNGYSTVQTALYGTIPKSLTPFENGDIVMAKVTPCFENGNIAIMEDLMSGIGFGSSELFVFRATSINTKYLFYWLRNNGFVQAAAATMMGTGGLKRISPQFVQNTLICVPSLSEQEKISNYLDSKCNEIDLAISEKRSQIEILFNYKKSLIYEYVTGKKEVPIAPNNTIVAVDPQAILLGGIVRRIGKSQHGRTQLQKLLYLCNTHLGLNLNIQYYRYEHGPYDVHLNDYIHELIKNQWFNEKKQEKNACLFLGKNGRNLNKIIPIHLVKRNRKSANCLSS